jgi:RNA polymerase sigma factor (sigma-70 family)
MTNGQLSPVSRFLRTIVLASGADNRSDVELLKQFRARRDDTAFEALVRRHGPMVWAVCRRILSNTNDAEDAFQATFLVFVRRAASLGRGASVGGWLHGVAYRTALRVRSQSKRFQRGERLLEEHPSPEVLPDLAWRELKLVLDEEVDRLPERYRKPFVLCYLEGKTYGQAAKHLGLPPGTISGQLARAREMLRVRLTRRGIAISAGILTTVLSARAAAASVPSALVASTIKTVTLFAAHGMAGSLVSPEVAAVTKGALNAMFMKRAFAAITVLGLLGVSVSLLGYHALAQGVARQDPLVQQPGTDSAKVPSGDKRKAVGQTKGKLYKIDLNLIDGPHVESVLEVGKRVSIPIGSETVTAPGGESVHLGVSYSAKVTKTKDGKLLLDVLVQNTKDEASGEDELKLHVYKTRLVKVVRLGDTAQLDLADHKDARGASLQITLGELARPKQGEKVLPNPQKKD